jgi:integrase
VAIRRDLAFLSSLYSSARHWDGGPQSNPIRDYDKKGLKDANARTNWLKPEEVERLIAACTTDYQKTFIILLVQTGLRYKEVLGLKWQNVDFHNRMIVIGNLSVTATKNGDSRIIPMTEQVHDTLFDTQNQCATEWVMANPKTGKPFTNLHKAWSGITRRAELPEVRIHDLRHTFASWALQRGVDPITTQTLLGHRTASMTRRYSHLNKEALVAAMERFARGTKCGTGAPDLCAKPSKPA